MASQRYATQHMLERRNGCSPVLTAYAIKTSSIESVLQNARRGKSELRPPTGMTRRTCRSQCGSGGGRR